MKNVIELKLPTNEHENPSKKVKAKILEKIRRIERIGSREFGLSRRIERVARLHREILEIRYLERDHEGGRQAIKELCDEAGVEKPKSPNSSRRLRLVRLCFPASKPVQSRTAAVIYRAEKKKWSGKKLEATFLKKKSITALAERLGLNLAVGSKKKKRQKRNASK